MEELKEETRFLRKAVLWIIGILMVTSVIGFFMTRTITVVDNGILHYEEFQEIYNTCTKLNLDLCNMKDLPETDKMFEQFSKAQRINTIKTNLNRWTEEYNAKSKMFNRSIWKSGSLPYQLSTNQFNCY